MVLIEFSLSGVAVCVLGGGVYGKPFYVSDINHQEKSGTGSLFLFVIKYLICCVSQLSCPSNSKLLLKLGQLIYNVWSHSCRFLPI